MPLMASCVYCTLGNAYHSLGNFSKAIEYRAQDLAIAKKVGDRAVEGMAYTNLGSAHQSQGDFSKAIKYHMHLQNCTWRTSPMRANRTRRWHISKEHLSWRVQRGRDLCLGCGQTQGEDTPMLTCSGCCVARFCSADHQKMASKKAASGGSLTMGRHKDICGVLSKWREVVKSVWRLTRALRTWWRFCSDACAIPQ